MTIRLPILISLLVLLRPSIGHGQDESQPMSLSNRVAEAEFIAVGRVSGALTESRFSNYSDISIEQVLYGSVPTNKTLVAWYATTPLLIPGVASTTHSVSPTNRYICFLVRGSGDRDSPDRFVMTPVGPRRWAHNGFELATTHALDAVRKLVAERSARK